MFEFIPAIGSLITYGAMGPFSKKSINDIGRHRAIIYSYLVLVLLLISGAVISSIIFNFSFAFPASMAPAYAAEIAIGALGAIASYKALDYGKASINSPLAKVYVLIIIVAGVIFLGEQLTTGQVAGGILIVTSAVLLALDSGRIKIEKWMVYLGISIICRAYYYTFIKDFVTTLGAYQASVFLETGVMLFTIAFHAARGKELGLPQPKKMGFVVGSGILFFLGSVLYSISVASVGAVLASVISAGSPIVNTVLSHFLLREKLDIVKYIAIILMIVGLVAIVI